MKTKLAILLEQLNKDANGKLLQADISGYVDKILKNATVLTIERNENLAAFIAFYCNDTNKNLAFLTMLAVNPNSRAQGYGKSLLALSISELKQAGFKKYALEVRFDNIKAIDIYKQSGFVAVEKNGDMIYMEKNLQL